MSFVRKETRKLIYERDGHQCAYCRRRGGNMVYTLDHLVPQDYFRRKNMAVDNKPTNLVTACRKCNASRKTTKLSIFVNNPIAYDRIMQQVQWPLGKGSYPELPPARR